MSRIIVKNLPRGMKEERLREIFSKEGCLTDCSLRYTPDGVFRKFAFVGYQDETVAQKAVAHYNRSFIDTSQIQVEIAKDFGDASKPRSWSKYSRDSSAYQKMISKLEEKQAAQKEENKKDKLTKQEKKAAKKAMKDGKLGELLGELKDDPQFEEFLEMHKNRTTKTTWGNDALVGSESSAKSTKGGKVGKDEVAFEGDSDDDSDEESEEEKDDATQTIKKDDGENEEEEEEKEDSATKGKKAKDNTAASKQLSDLEYLKAKMSSSRLLSDDDSSSSDSDEDDEQSGTNKKKKKGVKHASGESPTKRAEVDSEKEEGSDETDTKKKKKKKKKNKKEKEDSKETEKAGASVSDPDEMGSSEIVTHVIKIKGLPPTVKEKQIHEFFKPVKIKKVKIPKNASGKQAISFATVEFHTDDDTNLAMGKNKNFIGMKKLFLYKVKKETKDIEAEKHRMREIKKHERDQNETGEGEETIAESGRLFLRNLAYVCTEDNLEEHFSKFGPLTEVNLPVDSLTKKVKGFAFITFMIPEHAVKAFTELDGTVFQGRMLHILPAKAKKDDLEITENMSYKQKQELDKKKKASSSHNWNTLFLGANAIADVMAEKYGASKSQILDASGKQSLGVRMALGETQIVAETREFLIENGVALDAFSQAAAPRSKTVILIKNLPASTAAADLEALFSKYGTVGRVVMPPSGITAIVEYIEPSEARNGFRNLAYSKFQHVPLYLEWAPVGVFSTPAEKSAVKTEETADDQKTEDAKDENDNNGGKTEAMEVAETSTTKAANDSSSDDDDDPVEPESTLYVKNINFDTTEDSLRELFTKCGAIRNVSISKKKDMKNPGQFLSMGYGFIEYKKRASAQKAIKQLQHSTLDGHQLELKISSRMTIQQPTTSRKKQDTSKKQKSTKILVRNIPFEAKPHELRELFAVFGELKTVRMPQKLSGTVTGKTSSSHRGFGFVDFLTKQDAKRAFNALCHSTHLYGRRLVLEWAEAEETVEQLRRKTADHFHDGGPSKKLRKSKLMDDLRLGTSSTKDS